jgi:regulatory protein
MPKSKSARHTAMDLLARREHARGELASKLARKGYEPDEIDDALRGLADEELQSDVRYAEHFVNARAERGHGPVRIRNDLDAAGVESGIIEDAFAACGVDWRERARQVLVKRFGNEPATDYPEKARRMRFLSQRGFGMDEIRAAVGELDE